MSQIQSTPTSRKSYWLFQLMLALLWVALGLANVYSQEGQLQAVCFIPAGLSMALFMSYGAGAFPAVLLGSFTAFLIGSQSYLPSENSFYTYWFSAAFYALGHTLSYYFAARIARFCCGGFFRLEKPTQMFNVLYTYLFAAAVSALFGTQGLDFLSPVPASVWLDGFLMRWLATLTGILCFALSFITLMAFFRCERFFNYCHIDTHHLRRGLTLDRGIPLLILIHAMATFSLDWLGNSTGLSQVTVTWMGIVSLFILAWSALKMSYGAVSVLVAAFSLTLLITLSAFWANFHVANVQILLPVMAIAGTFIWSLSSSESSNKVLHQLANTDELTGCEQASMVSNCSTGVCPHSAPSGRTLRDFDRSGSFQKDQ